MAANVFLPVFCKSIASLPFCLSFSYISPEEDIFFLIALFGFSFAYFLYFYCIYYEWDYNSKAFSDHLIHNHA